MKLHGAVDISAGDAIDSLRVFEREEDRDAWVKARWGADGWWSPWENITLEVIDPKLAASMIAEEREFEDSHDYTPRG